MPYNLAIVCAIGMLARAVPLNGFLSLELQGGKWRTIDELPLSA